MFNVILLILIVGFFLIDLVQKILRSKKKKAIFNSNTPKYIKDVDINEFHPGTGHYGWEELFFKETNKGTWFKGFLTDEEMQVNGMYFDPKKFPTFNLHEEDIEYEFNEIRKFHNIDFLVDKKKIIFFVPSGESEYTLAAMEDKLN